eukprot:CAMPEP_0114632738 /NCGR_PEP_ID=MMETSP0168-20121206/15088_1 /TAXON_ID=95228 ORGANISM="Vannella sp., Strain DIVA3 517/6/12" /NCGR_SAMPLE_ID=MMETSP0168 /ASSEMBLY_ACC=CAM_ASM_000044 /LENGTH=93 /DNA_ID=CAMNT_0001844355 /DNA_START=390 /DNA_END=668 /DNA_ORIENTATION=-
MQYLVAHVWRRAVWNVYSFAQRFGRVDVCEEEAVDQGIQAASPCFQWRFFQLLPLLLRRLNAPVHSPVRGMANLPHPALLASPIREVRTCDLS